MIDITNIKCVYITPCGWCSKWDKECDKKINKLVEFADDFATVAKMCESESDHEWECVGVSLTGTAYRCKKCGDSKIIPYLSSVTLNNMPLDNIPNCCKLCPNHPSNGGSGICNCTAPYFEHSYNTVTC